MRFREAAHLAAVGSFLGSALAAAQEARTETPAEAVLPPPIPSNVRKILIALEKAAEAAEAQRDVASQTTSYASAVKAAESVAETVQAAQHHLEELELLARQNPGTLDVELREGRAFVSQAEDSGRLARRSVHVLEAATLEAIAKNTEPSKKIKDEDEKVLLNAEAFGERRGWSGALFKFAENEKKVSAEATMPLGARVRIKVGVTAPLDEETRVAALTKDGSFVPFEGSLEFEFDETSKFLDSILAREPVGTRFAIASRFNPWLAEEKAAHRIPQSTHPNIDVDDEHFQRFLKSEFCPKFKNQGGDCSELDELNAFAESEVRNEKRRSNFCPQFKAQGGDCSKLDELDAFIEKEIRKEAAELRRELKPARPYSATSLAVPLGATTSWGARFEAGYDRLEIFDSLAAPSGTKQDALELRTTAFARIYPNAWLALPVSAGVHYKNKPEVEKFRHCIGDTATDTGGDGEQTISGQACNDSALLLKAAGTPSWSADIEVAAVLVPLQEKLGKLAPGFEFRERLEGIGDELLSRSSVGIFVTPTDKVVVTRFGVAVEHLYSFDDEDSTLTPVILAGGSL